MQQVPRCAVIAVHHAEQSIGTVSLAILWYRPSQSMTVPLDIVCWNSLPSVVRNIKTLPAFKSALCSIDLSDFLRGSAFRF
jgi:hypothetical protein